MNKNLLKTLYLLFITFLNKIKKELEEPDEVIDANN